MLTLGRLTCSSILDAAGIQKSELIKQRVLLRVRLQVYDRPFPILDHCCRGEERTDPALIQEVKLVFFCSLYTLLYAMDMLPVPESKLVGIFLLNNLIPEYKIF